MAIAAAARDIGQGTRANARDALRVLSAEDYARGEQFMPYSANELVLHAIEALCWLPDGRFCYRTRVATGFTSFVVDPVANTCEVAFDEAKVRAALQHAQAIPRPCNWIPPLEGLELEHGGVDVSFRIGNQRWRCNREGRECSLLQEFDGAAVLSPDEQHEAFIRDHNLWMRALVDGRETQLTFDGVRDFGYATDNSARRHSCMPVLSWSPDSQRIATFQLDERGVGEMFLVRTQRGHPDIESWKYAMPGDRVLPKVHRVVVEVRTRQVTRLRMPPDLVRSASWLGLADDTSGELEAQWSADSAQLAFISISRDHKCATLRIADAASGAVRDVVAERSSTFYEAAISAWHASRGRFAANWRYLAGSREIIWYSARDNWNHLYLYDADTGELKFQITSGEWNVVTLWSIDERERVIYFSASGREKGKNPYFEHLYRVGLDGWDLQLLTPEDATHVIWMAPTGAHFVDSYSRPDAAPTTVLRDRSGSLLRTLERADISRLKALGWVPPTPITVKARDGVTDLHGLLFKPARIQKGRKYPIVNAIHSGPVLGSVIPQTRRPQWGVFAAAYGGLGDAQSLAELGFVVVMVDGIGTPLRSRTFHQFSHGNYGDATLPDQIAAMRQLAQRHPWIDLERAGIYGASHGGYAAARAMLTFPDFFKVGVAISGNHDPASYQDEYGEKFLGLLLRDEAGASNYDLHANLGLARNLRGRLLLVHGTLDDNVPLQQTLLLAKELIEANKDFDLLLLPNATHSMLDGNAGRYLVRRHWDYFVQHLMGAVPPTEYAMRASQD